MKHPSLSWLLAGGLLLAAGSAHAHGIESSLERLAPLTDGRAFERARPGAASLQLESRFSTGEPARDAAVRLMPPDGAAPIEVGRTDAEGRLTFALPSRSRSDWEVQVDAGPGHRDYLELPTAAAATPSASAPSAPDGRLPLQAAVPLSALALLGIVVAVPRLRRRP